MDKFDVVFSFSTFKVCMMIVLYIIGRPYCCSGQVNHEKILAIEAELMSSTLINFTHFDTLINYYRTTADESDNLFVSDFIHAYQGSYSDTLAAYVQLLKGTSDKSLPDSLRIDQLKGVRAKFEHLNLTNGILHSYRSLIKLYSKNLNQSEVIKLCSLSFKYADWNNRKITHHMVDLKHQYIRQLLSQGEFEHAQSELVSLECKIKKLEFGALRYMGIVYNDFVDLMSKIRDYESQLYYAKKFMLLTQENNLKMQHCNALENVAGAFRVLRLYDSASCYYDRILDLDCGPKMKVYGWEGKSNVSFALGNLDIGLNYLKNAISLSKEIGFAEKSEKLMNNLIQYYYHSGKYGDVIETYKNMKEVDRTYYHIATKYFILTLAEISGGKKLSIPLSKYISKRDSLYKVRVAENIHKVQIKHEREKKDAEIKLLELSKLKDEIKLKQRYRYVVMSICTLVFLSIFLLVLMRSNRKKKLINAKIKRQHAEIQLMNRELNHRVKNNLAFMTSLLEMQGRRSETAEAKEVLRESETRLHALSLVHSNLFKNKSDSKLNLRDYLGEICRHLSDIFEIPGKNLEFDTDFIDYIMDAEDAMRAGLIVNELVTNSVKHAFGDVTDPVIRIHTLKHNNSLVLRYKDNGPGITKTLLEETALKEGNSLGHKLIQLLERQLEGKLILEYNMDHRTQP